MTNKRYQKGYRFELAVMRDWEAEGYLCCRTAGSHGVADVWAAKAAIFGGLPRADLFLIQCKASERLPSLYQLEALKDSAAEAGGTPLVATKPGRGKIGYHRVTKTRLVPFELE